jgi:hypothetical protein
VPAVTDQNDCDRFKVLNPAKLLAGCRTYFVSSLELAKKESRMEPLAASGRHTTASLAW